MTCSTSEARRPSCDDIEQFLDLREAIDFFWLRRWLAALDDFRNWLIGEAAYIGDF